MPETNLPALPDARLPVTYETAQKALDECSRIDECKGWADRAAALASYARQAKDDSLRLLALRIQARAERRCGELLKQIPRADESTRFGQDGAVPPVTRSQAATEAGLSERQRKTALRIASVPEADFKAAVEGPNPPTISELAMRGTVSRAPTALTIVPVDLIEAGETQSALQAFAEFCREHDAASNAVTLSSADAQAIRDCVGRIDAWLDRFITHLPPLT